MKNFKIKPLWIALSMLLTIILGTIYAITDFGYTLTLISCIPWVLFIAVYTVFAWIINPISRYMKKINKED